MTPDRQHDLNAAMHRAQYERTEDGAVFASIPGLDGLWATGQTVKEARWDLRDTLDGWLTVKQATHDDIPITKGSGNVFCGYRL